MHREGNKAMFADFLAILYESDVIDGLQFDRALAKLDEIPYTAPLGARAVIIEAIRKEERE